MKQVAAWSSAGKERNVPCCLRVERKEKKIYADKRSEGGNIKMDDAERQAETGEKFCRTVILRTKRFYTVNVCNIEGQACLKRMREGEVSSDRRFLWDSFKDNNW